MENNEKAKLVENGVSDISGVKNASVLSPEQNECAERFVAESADASKLSEKGSAEKSKESSEISNAEKLEEDQKSSEISNAGKMEEDQNSSEISNAEKLEEDQKSSASSDGENTEENESEEELEKLFDTMISGKFRNAYRKRTESIVRKRLRSGKARPDTKDMLKDEKATAENVTEAPQNSVSDKEAFRDTISRNRARPTENGCGGSIGMVSKINVNALNGSDVRSILRRALAGEKITFK